MVSKPHPAFLSTTTSTISTPYFLSTPTTTTHAILSSFALRWLYLNVRRSQSAAALSHAVPPAILFHELPSTYITTSAPLFCRRHLLSRPTATANELLSRPAYIVPTHLSRYPTDAACSHPLLCSTTTLPAASLLLAALLQWHQWPAMKMIKEEEEHRSYSSPTEKAKNRRMIWYIQVFIFIMIYRLKKSIHALR